jgi:hypothetical protein
MPPPGQHDHMPAGVGIRRLDRALQRHGHVVVDGVQHLGPVQRDPGKAAVHLMQHLVHDLILPAARAMRAGHRGQVAVARVPP